VLRNQYCRPVPPDGPLCWQGSQGRKTGGVAGVAAIKFEMAINLQTAKALSLNLSNNLLSLADEVIE
jgi:hypothetical protein